MYQASTAKELKTHFKLPEDYSVTGFFSYGSWNRTKHLKKLYQAFDYLKIEYSSKRLKGFLNNIIEIKVGDKRYWFSILYGGALLSEYVNLACLFGSQKNIHLGSCGGLYHKVSSLDYLIPSFSYGDESSTRIYARDIKDHRHLSDKNLSDLLASKINPNNKVWRGPVITCQGMLGETLEDVNSWSKAGYYGVEMETSTLFSVSNNFKVPSAALLYVSDNLIAGQTVHSEEYLKQAKTRELKQNNLYYAGILSLID